MTWAPDRPPCGADGRHQVAEGDAPQSCPCGAVTRRPQAVPRPRGYVITPDGARHLVSPAG